MIIESESKKSKIKITYKHVAVKLSFCQICGLWWRTNAIYLYRLINKGTPKEANHKPYSNQS
jgi:ribosomal protein L32